MRQARKARQRIVALSKELGMDAGVSERRCKGTAHFCAEMHAKSYLSLGTLD